MNLNTKIRILLVDDPLPALFMAAYLRQLQQRRSEPIRTIAIYDGLELNREHFLDFERQQKTHIESSQILLRGLIADWAVFPTKRYHVTNASPLRLRDMLDERAKRRDELKRIRSLLEEKNIDSTSIVEIWSRDAFVDSHFHHLCPQAKVFFFDHGLSDIRNALMSGQCDPRQGRLGRLPKWISSFLRRARIQLSNFIEVQFYFFAHIDSMRATRVSLLADEIRLGNSCHQKLDRLSPSSILEATKPIVHEEMKLTTAIEGPCALILLMYVYHKPWNKSFENDQLKMLRDFEEMVTDVYANRFEELGIKTLVFKGRLFHEDFSAEGVRAFEKLRKRFKVIYLSDFSPRNFPTEYYLALLNPKIILSAYSSAGVFAKKLLPDIQSITYDRWFTKYIQNEFKSKFDDFAWYRPLFGEKFGAVFKDLLPDDEPKSNG